MDRRDFLQHTGAGLAGALLGPLALGAGAGCATPTGGSLAHIGGGLRGAGHRLGHRLRRPDLLPPPTRTDATDVLIVGGGVSGLSARRWLHRHAPATRTLLLELEPHTGGNAAGGRNARTAYPWGAHYLPLPDPHDGDLLDFLAQAGVLTGYAPGSGGLPVYHEPYLCHDPAERLLVHGHWQAGLVPSAGVPAADQAEIARFLAYAEELRHAAGADGRPAFALPLVGSSADAKFRQLDAEPFAAWLDARRYRSPYLRWYLDYCCLDDYGAPAAQVSAWAGLHYFAARKGRAHNAAPDAVLTWPEGNGFLAEALRQQGGAADNIRPQTLAYALHAPAHPDGPLEVFAFDAATEQSWRIRTQKVLLATPWHVTERLLAGLPAPAGQPAPALRPHHAPWLVANLTVRALPESAAGQPLCWDNVRYGSPALGYLDAEHQALRGHDAPGPRTLTFYLPLPGPDPAAARRAALLKTHADWLPLVLQELELMHPGLTPAVETAELWLWGHGMAAPVPGYVWGPARAEAARPRLGGRLHFAHTDLSGISVFEEAFHQGIGAAQALLGEI